MVKHNISDFLIYFITTIIVAKAQEYTTTYKYTITHNNIYKIVYDINCGDRRRAFMKASDVNFLDDFSLDRRTAISYYNEALLFYDKGHLTFNAYGYIIETIEDIYNFCKSYKNMYKNIQEEDIKNLIEIFKYLGGFKITKKKIDTHLKILNEDVDYYNKWCHKLMQFTDAPLKTQ